VEAQFSGDVMGQNISVALSPQYPNPGETVTATLDDYALGIVGGEIEWLIDGAMLSDSKNSRKITFVASEVGKPQTVEVRLKLPTGALMSTKSTIVPIYVDIIIEPQTYTPLFYQGRGLPSFGSPVILTAIVTNSSGLIDPGTHTYSWFLNDTALGGGPIRGGHKTKMVVPYGESSIITLSIIDRNGVTIAQRLVEVPSVKVDVQFYEVSTLFGLSEKSVVGNLPLIGNSTTVRAVPYNLDRSAVNGDIFTEWKINNRKQTSASRDPFEVTLLRQGVGSSQVSFKVRNLSALIQSDEESFTVQY